MISGSPVDMGGCVNIVRLHVSDVVTPDSHPLPNTVISNYVYLVSTASGVLLFDTGLGPPHDELDAIACAEEVFAEGSQSRRCSSRRIREI